MTKKLVCLILFFFFASFSMADATLTQSEIRRLTEAKTLLMNAEARSIDEIIDEINASGMARVQLQVYEAIAITFRDIINKYGENSPESRVQLLGKVRMNMAYFQFGGPDTDRPEDGALNRLIRRKLKHYLPEDIWDNPKLFHSLE